ncbi:hypothetical protein [Thiofaba sp. EF100]|uniref:hypothetical protein n=1 Tax=Thiofaba sp. EF100 TaxID=3121274 RepID=UPI003221B531
MPVSECLHEFAQHFGRMPVFSQASPLEPLAEFLFNTDTEASVFAQLGGTLAYGYTNVYPIAALGEAQFEGRCDELAAIFGIISEKVAAALVAATPVPLGLLLS